MTNQIPENALIVDDNGSPIAMMNIDQVQMQAIQLGNEMAAACHDHDALDALSEKWINRVGVDAFGCVAAGALRHVVADILDPSLHVLEQVAPGMPSMRGKLAKIAAEDLTEKR
ncbi:hypothetical protein [Rhodococcus sp. NPDC058521]|uniref:hypothetical protein n=1 Tax=Rhodococcus sp. NPDC058521 TaxID=3346536 RepID=UPI0036693D47